MPLIYTIFLMLIMVCSGFANAQQENKHNYKATNLENAYIKMELERIVDGDTFVASGERIRLWGIDAPEKKHPLFEVSTTALQYFLNASELECKQVDVDKYQRLVMHCFTDKADLGALMVKSGFAKDFKKYSGGFYDSEQSFAKSNKLGLWK